MAAKSAARPTRAISIRQPFVELILKGKKKTEYRSRPTRLRERVWLYASLRPHPWKPGWRAVGKQPGQLPTGVIVGSVEIVDCKWSAREEAFAYVLDKPKPIRKALVPKNQPQPVFWRPEF